MPPDLADECFNGCINYARSCYYEWLVKWTGLGYEHATWEFENSSFLRSSEGIALIRDFESRQEKGRKLFNSSKTDKVPLKAWAHTMTVEILWIIGLGIYPCLRHWSIHFCPD